MSNRKQQPRRRPTTRPMLDGLPATGSYQKEESGGLWGWITRKAREVWRTVKGVGRMIRKLFTGIVRSRWTPTVVVTGAWAVNFVIDAWSGVVGDAIGLCALVWAVWRHYSNPRSESPRPTPTKLSVPGATFVSPALPPSPSVA